MDTETRDDGGEAISSWKQIVQALWTLNYVSVGFKGLFPRLRGMSPSLDTLAQAIPLIRRTSTTDVLEEELRETLGRFTEAIELLTSGREEMSGLLGQLEQHRLDLEDRE